MGQNQYFWQTKNSVRHRYQLSKCCATGRQATTTNGLCLERSEVLRSLGHFFEARHRPLAVVALSTSLPARSFPLLLSPRSGELRTQKLKSHLVRTQSLNILPLKPGVGQYIAIHATLTARDFFLAHFYSSGPFTCIFSKPLPIFSLF